MLLIDARALPKALIESLLSDDARAFKNDAAF